MGSPILSQEQRPDWQTEVRKFAGAQDWVSAVSVVDREVARTGPHHDPQIRVMVELPAFTPAEGRGRSKRAAEQAAAAAMLSREGVEAAG